MLLTFLDPVCTTDCPLIAQEFKATAAMLGPQARQTELVAIVANPTYYSTQFTQALDRQEGLSTVPDWLYLTGTLTQLRSAWQQYGVTVQNLQAGAMSAHNDLAFVIDRAGVIRQEIDADPGPGTTSTLVVVRRAVRRRRPSGAEPVITARARHPRRNWRWLMMAAAVSGTAVLAGCAGGSGAGSGGTAAPAPAGTASLVTSMTTANGATWAIVAMGGSAAAANQFWELFTRAAASDRWELVTPPGVASNGGLVAAGGPATLSVAFRPSQGLTFSPLAVTSDGGKTWRTGLIDAPVASDPDALAAGARAMLALLGDGTVEQRGTAGASWTRLAAPGAIASSAAGRQCHVTSLTAVAYAPSGTPLAAASCARPGITGIFARSGIRLAGGRPCPRRPPGHGAAAHRYRRRGPRAAAGQGGERRRPCSPPGRATEPGGRSQPRWLSVPGK